MSAEEPEIRIGDAERDDAISLLQEHLSAGRLDNEEFDTRIGKALQARTFTDLSPLFADLPGRHPGQSVEPPGPHYVVEESAETDSDLEQPGPYASGQRLTRHWYAQWWIIPALVLLALGTRVNLGVVVPLAMVWMLVAGPLISRRRRGPRSVRAINMAERHELQTMLSEGLRVKAIKRHRQMTGSDLSTAVHEIDQLQQEQRGW